jgi:hypothetical protein
MLVTKSSSPMIKSVAKIQEQLRTLADELAHQGLRAKAKRLRCLATQMEPHAYAGLVITDKTAEPGATYLIHVSDSPEGDLLRAGERATGWGKPRLRRAGLNSYKVTR